MRSTTVWEQVFNQLCLQTPEGRREGDVKGRMKIEIINLFFSFGQNPSEFFFGALGIFLRKLPYSGSLDRPRGEICQNKSYSHVTLTDTDVTNYEVTLLRTAHKTGAKSYMYVTLYACAAAPRP